MEAYINMLSQTQREELRRLLFKEDDSNFEIHDIDYFDDFDKRSIELKHNEYTSLKACATDLSRIMRRVMKSSEVFIQKEYNVSAKCSTFKWLEYSTMKTQLSAIKLPNVPLASNKRTEYTAWDAFEKYRVELSVRDVCFKSDNPDVFSWFHGYKYQPADEINFEILKPFAILVHDVIAAGDDQVYDYIMKWMAWIVRNPGQKAGTALVIMGSQGAGKNMFSDTFSELLGQYAAKNITSIDEISGQFNSVIEGKMLIVCNEMSNNGDGRMGNFDALKSIITENSIRINEKCQPRHDAENVANFIFISNNKIPVRIEPTDRRYLVTIVDAKYSRTDPFWTQFVNTRNDPEFYPTLLKLLNRYNLSNFHPQRDLPLTFAWKRLKDSWLTPYIKEFIKPNYELLTTGRGIPKKSLLYNDWQWKPDCISEGNFIAENNLYLKLVKARHGDEREMVWKLRNEYWETFKPVDEENE